MKFKQFASGYLIKDNKVLLVHHRKFNKWVPPGGHIEDEETPDQTLTREFLEETSLKIAVIRTTPSPFEGDSNATPIPVPFYMDLEREGFDVPHIGHFYFVKVVGNNFEVKHQETEAHEIKWFTIDEIDNLETFDQVKALAKFAIKNYPA